MKYYQYNFFYPKYQFPLRTSTLSTFTEIRPRGSLSEKMQTIRLLQHLARAGLRKGPRLVRLMAKK